VLVASPAAATGLQIIIQGAVLSAFASLVDLNLALRDSVTGTGVASRVAESAQPPAKALGCCQATLASAGSASFGHRSS
jgi:hypothetical protein